MKQTIQMFLLFILGLFTVAAHASTTTLTTSQTQAQWQSAINTAAGSTGNTVAFSAGTYALSSTLSMPCTNGIVYTGPNVGVVTISNPATATFTGPNTSSFSISIASNGSGLTPAGAGCTITNLGWSGQHGGIEVHYPSSGLFITSNFFTLNDGNVGGSGNMPNIQVDGSCPGSGSGNLCPASDGNSNSSFTNNVFYNECATIRGTPSTDSGGSCAAIFTHGSSFNTKFTGNTIDLIEQGFKWQEVYYQITNVANNLDVEDNNIQGQSRIAMENQQATNGVGIFSHNAMFAPYNPGLYTFDISVPGNGGFQVNDDAYIAGGVQVYGHYGYGLEIWGNGNSSQYNLFQGANTTAGCGAGFFCQGWATIIGPGSGGTYQNNYFSGADVWGGTVNNVSKAYTVEDGGVLANNTITTNTVIQNSTTIQVATPTITPGTTSVTIAPPDTNHHYSIFYTTDGSTPHIFVPGSSSGTSQLYTGAFTPSNGATVKAIAHWGILANQGIVFPVYGYVPSSVVTATYTGSGGSVTLSSIAITGTNTAIAGGSNVSLTATGTYSNSTTGAVTTTSTWVSSDTTKCTVGANTGVVTPVAAGTCSITAQLGAVVSTPFTFTVTASTLTGGFLGTTPTAGINQLIVGNTQQMIATGTYSSGGSGTFPSTVWSTSSSSSICTIGSSTGIVTAVGAGSCTINAMSGSTSSSSWVFNISSATLTSITVSAPSSTMAINATQIAAAQGFYNNSTSAPLSPAAWNSDAPTVCTVNSTGLITAVAQGTCNITAAVGSVTSGNFTIQVQAPSPSLVSIATSPMAVTITQSATLNAVGTFSDNSVSVVSAQWVSTNTNVVTVDANGVLTPVGIGTSYVTATVGTISGTSTVVVPPNVFYQTATPPIAFPYLSPNFGCYVFQKLSTGTYTLTVNADGTYTVQ